MSRRVLTQPQNGTDPKRAELGEQRRTPSAGKSDASVPEVMVWNLEPDETGINGFGKGCGPLRRRVTDYRGKERGGGGGGGGGVLETGNN